MVSLLAKHAQNKGGPDLILTYSKKASARSEAVGKENIINATVGSFLEDDGSLKVMRTVEEALQEVSFSDSAEYSPTVGEPQFIEALLKSVFLEKRPKAYLGTVATPGGTGALRNASFNYLEAGEACITTDFYWSNYTNLLAENGRILETFETFTKEGGFNVSACLNKCREVSKCQRNLMLLLNTPAHNPTGCEVSFEEWGILIEGLKEIANNGKNNVILVVDVAYIDFAGEGARDFFVYFNDLPENFLVIICTSMSKGYTLYGYRLGAMIGLSQNESVIEEFLSANSASARATWSNSSRPAMMAIANIYNDAQRLATFREEEKALALALKERADLFINEASEVNLELCPYQSGFFVTIPLRCHEMSVAVAKVLEKKDIFVVPQGRGVRIAICAVPKEKLQGLASACKAAILEVEKNFKA